MQKILHSIRQKSPHARAAVALSLAFVLTAIIAVIWGLSLGSNAPKPATKAPTPFSALVNSLKEVVSKKPAGNVEIIDANKQ